MNCAFWQSIQDVVPIIESLYYQRVNSILCCLCRKQMTYSPNPKHAVEAPFLYVIDMVHHIELHITTFFQVLQQYPALAQFATLVSTWICNSCLSCISSLSSLWSMKIHRNVPSNLGFFQGLPTSCTCAFENDCQHPKQRDVIAAVITGAPYKVVFVTRFRVESSG